MEQRTDKHQSECHDGQCGADHEDEHGRALRLVCPPNSPGMS